MNAKVVLGYAYVGAWFGLVLGLCGINAHLGTINLSMMLAATGALIGTYRAQRIARSQV